MSVEWTSLFTTFVVHKAVDHVGALPLGGTDDCRVKQQVPLIDKAVDANAFAFAEVFERMCKTGNYLRMTGRYLRMAELSL